MSVKQRSVVSFFFFALTALGVTTGLADVDVALNLSYHDPIDPSEGGTWTLVAKTDTTGSTGITDLVVRLTNMPPSGTVHPGIGHDVNGGVLGIATIGLDTEFTYGQDPNDGLVANVGLGTSPSLQENDPLRNNTLWGNVSVIATGTIADLSSRPTFVSLAANEIIDSIVSPTTIDAVSVRGDAAEALGIEEPGTGLRQCDANRDGDCDTGDLSLLLTGFPLSPDPFPDPPIILGWLDGDFNDSGDVDTGDLSLLLTAFPLPPTNPGPPITAVPEPDALALAVLAVVSLAIGSSGNRKVAVTTAPV